MIKLLVIKTEKNANYDEEVRRLRESGMGMYDNRRGEAVREEITSELLSVAITEEQWEKIRKATIENF